LILDDDESRCDPDPGPNNYIVNYNYDPDAMGVDYFVQVVTPVNEGRYMVDYRCRAEAGVWMSSVLYGGEMAHTNPADDYTVWVSPASRLTHRLVKTATGPAAGLRTGSYLKRSYDNPPLTVEGGPSIEALVFIPEEDILMVCFADFYVERTDT